MLNALTKLLDPQRAAELVDFILIFALLVTVGMAVLFGLFLLRSRKLHREIRESSAELYYFLLATLALDGKDHRLIKRMAAFLPYPLQKHRIMVNPGIFDACSRRLAVTEEVGEDELQALRDKLGFPGESQNMIPASSRDLLVDTPVVLVQSGKSMDRGRVSAIAETSLVIRLERGSSEPPSDGSTTVYFRSPAGFFSFATRITGREKGLMHLAHSEKIKRYLRRRYARKPSRLPVFVQPQRGAATSLKSALLDISGGGASLQNPGSVFQIDQQIGLSFAPHGKRFHVLARVVRVSRGGQVIHDEFQGVEESDRKRITRSIF